MRDVERAMKDIENEAAQTENAVEQLFGARPRRPSKGARRILGPVLHRRSIRRMSRERDFDGLAAALVSRDPLLSRKAAVALCRLGDPQVVPALLSVYDTAFIGRGACGLVIRHLGEKAVAPLRDALEYDGDHDRRSIAGAALGALGEEHSLEILLEALTSEDPSLRIAAVAGLDGLDSGRVVEPLIGALRDPSVGVRELAAMSLGEVNDSRAVEPLIGALEGDPDPSVRRAAAESLSFLGRPRAAEALRRVASRGLEEDAFVRDIVAHALWRLEYLERLNGG